jgi:zinc transporter ZupT
VDSQNSKTNTNSVSQASNHQAAANNPATDQDEIAPCACCSDDPLKDLETLKIMADEMEHGNKEEAKREELDLEHGHSHEHSDHCVDEHDEPRTCGDQIVEQSVEVSDDDEQRPKDEDARLLRMSINTALAIALHNFPEGLATFVGTLNNPKVGAVLAVAIAIHNIPEGLCVAMPIYYATGNRRKAFMWAVLSGASEPFAALLGWAVLANSFSSSMYAILFGLVAGMMVTISARELLPTAHRYDPEDSVATYSFILGMGVMALSLILFVV